MFTLKYSSLIFNFCVSHLQENTNAIIALAQHGNSQEILNEICNQNVSFEKTKLLRASRTPVSCGRQFLKYLQQDC